MLRRLKYCSAIISLFMIVSCSEQPKDRKAILSERCVQASINRLPVVKPIEVEIKHHCDCIAEQAISTFTDKELEGSFDDPALQEKLSGIREKCYSQMAKRLLSIGFPSQATIDSFTREGEKMIKTLEDNQKKADSFDRGLRKVSPSSR